MPPPRKKPSNFLYIHFYLETLSTGKNDSFQQDHFHTGTHQKNEPGLGANDPGPRTQSTFDGIIQDELGNLRDKQIYKKGAA